MVYTVDRGDKVYIVYMVGRVNRVNKVTELKQFGIIMDS